MLSPFAISPQQTSPDLLFYWLPLCSASALANTSKDTRTEPLILKLWFLERGLNTGPQGTKNLNYVLGYGKYHYRGSRQGWWDIKMGCAPRPQSTCLLRLVAASLFTPSAFFWSAAINMNFNSYEVAVQVVGAWSYVWSGVPLQFCSPTLTKSVHGAFADHSRVSE